MTYLESYKFTTKKGHKQNTALHYASKSGHLKVAQALIDHGALPNVLNSHKMTPIMIASERGHYDMVKLLLAADASPFGINTIKKGPINYAIINGHLNVVSLLVRHGVNPNVYEKVFKFIGLILLETLLFIMQQHMDGRK
jgi:ankyrin repeat protein